MSPRTFRIALLGHGTVGGAFSELLPQRAEQIEHTTGMRPEISGVLTRSRGDFDDILARSDLVVELMGGTEPAREYALRALNDGRHVVTANAGVTLYRVVTVKPGAPPWVAVDGGMSDNLRPMLYGARYQAAVADRFAGATACRLVGKHCESGDVLIAEAELADPRPGDVVAVPATGAYGHALANNYNGVPRPPVVLCRDGDARVVVRRETYDDLLARDVDF